MLLFGGEFLEFVYGFWGMFFYSFEHGAIIFLKYLAKRPKTFSAKVESWLLITLSIVTSAGLWQEWLGRC